MVCGLLPSATTINSYETKIRELKLYALKTYLVGNCVTHASGGKVNSECLLRDIDMPKSFFIRDVVRNDRNKSKTFVIVENAKQSEDIMLSTVYIISVLMVSCYSNIIDK